MGEEDDTIDGVADMRGPTGSGCKGNGEACGRGRCAGPRARPACCALAGLLCAGGPRSRAGPGCEAFSSFLFFSVFFFYSLDSNSNLVFKFGFQIGAPYSLEFLI